MNRRVIEQAKTQKGRDEEEKDKPLALRKVSLRTAEIAFLFRHAVELKVLQIRGCEWSRRLRQNVDFFVVIMRKITWILRLAALLALRLRI